MKEKMKIAAIMFALIGAFIYAIATGPKQPKESHFVEDVKEAHEVAIEAEKEATKEAIEIKVEAAKEVAKEKAEEAKSWFSKWKDKE